MITWSMMADVLERAADLYESEKVEWCAGRWVKVPRILGEATISGCAATAVAMAAGLSHQVAQVIGGSSMLDRIYQTAVRNHAQIADQRKQAELYIAVRVFVDQRVMAMTEGAMASVVIWNDTQPLLQGKQNTIDLFKEIAKDMRNEDGDDN
jgi:hypothetical protein